MRIVLRHNPQSLYAISHRNRDFGIVNCPSRRNSSNCRGLAGGTVFPDQSGRPAIARRHFAFDRRSNKFIARERWRPWMCRAGRPLPSADCSRPQGARILVSKLHAPNYGAAANVNLDDNRRCAGRTSPVVVIPCATGRRSAKTSRGWPRCFQPRTCEAFPPRQTPFRKGKPVASFVVALAKVTSPGRERWATALQPDSSAFRPLLLKAHSRTRAFESPGESRRAPGTTPAAQALPGLVAMSIQSVTSLEGDTPRILNVRTSSRRRGVCATESVTISAGRNKKRPLTHRPGRFAVWHRL